MRERKIRKWELEKIITYYPLFPEKEGIVKGDLSEKMIIDRSMDRSTAFTIAGMLLLIMSPLFIFTPFTWGISSFILFICNLPFLYFLYIGCFNPHWEIIFNRIAGTISYSSEWGWGNPKIIIFEETPFIIRRAEGKLNGYKTSYLIEILYTHGLFGYLIFDGSEKKDTLSYWSFIVWYMDKNRPLPTGEIFDPYQEADYQRRKLAGFPKPLYPSQIPIPKK